MLDEKKKKNNNFVRNLVIAFSPYRTIRRDHFQINSSILIDSLVNSLGNMKQFICVMKKCY